MGWFAKDIERRVGNGVETFFWSSTVAVMSDIGWGVGGVAWSWRRQLWTSVGVAARPRWRLFSA
ncbi:hypothetical protein A2U01_0049279, partial [Trifolium medium]|nr:hypothetical protein [Trifolium medium]